MILMDSDIKTLDISEINKIMVIELFKLDKLSLQVIISITTELQLTTEEKLAKNF